MGETINPPKEESTKKVEERESKPLCPKCGSEGECEFIEDKHPQVGIESYSYVEKYKFKCGDKKCGFEDKKEKGRQIYTDLAGTETKEELAQREYDFEHDSTFCPFCKKPGKEHAKKA